MEVATLYGGARDSWGQRRIPKLCFVSLSERTTIPLGRKSSSEHTVGEQEHRAYNPPRSTALRSMIEASTAHSARMERTAHSAQRTAHSAQHTEYHPALYCTMGDIPLYTAFYYIQHSMMCCRPLAQILGGPSEPFPNSRASNPWGQKYTARPNYRG